jgi:FkbM family methyltransferase
LKGLPVNASSADYRNGRRFILCDLICSGNLLATPLVIIDAGALDAFTGSRWTKLPADKVRVHGFEPDVPECQRLNRAAASAGVDFRFHPVALARHTGPAEFYRFAEPAANSFYAANHRLISRWCYTRTLTLASQFKVLERPSLDAVSLDDWAKMNAITDVDFVKLNVQGAELDILAGAGILLQNTLGLLVEQTFNATYVGAPLFGEVYDFISNAGFCMFDVVGMNRVARTRSPIHITEDKIFVVDGHWPHHQFLEGHFFYLRDPIAGSDVWNEGLSLSLEKCLKLACLAEMFGQIEYAFEILEWIAASPRAGKAAVVCREIVDRGANIYRRVSKTGALARAPAAGRGEVPPVLPDGVSGTAETRLNAGEPVEQVDVDRLQSQRDAAVAESVYLRDALQQVHDSTTWKIMQPVRDFIEWARTRGLMRRGSKAASED